MSSFFTLSILIYNQQNKTICDKYSVFVSECTMVPYIQKKADLNMPEAMAKIENFTRDEKEYLKVIKFV